MDCMYGGMPKGTSWVEATLISEKIKLVALAVIELCLSEVSQSVGQSVGRSVGQLVGRLVSQSVSQCQSVKKFL